MRELSKNEIDVVAGGGSGRLFSCISEASEGSAAESSRSGEGTTSSVG